MGALLFQSDGAPRPYVQKPTNKNLLYKLDVKMNNPMPPFTTLQDYSKLLVPHLHQCIEIIILF